MNRSWKKLLLKAFNPVDYAARVLNNKTHLPPLDLRWDVGPLRNFEASAAEFRVYLKLFAGLQPASRVLDIGCGCGQIALELRDELDERGSYVGGDINSDAIDWCRCNLSDKRFSFFHMDVRNGMYNPSGKQEASGFKFQLDGSFDVILVKSVFTHMLQEEVENYLSQMAQLLRPNGKCLATFFLLNDKQKELARAARNRISFHPISDVVAVSDPNNPEAIVAFEEARLREMLSPNNLSVATALYGNWSGNQSHLSHQDILILQRT